jgi:hypothetical protein
MQSLTNAYNLEDFFDLDTCICRISGIKKEIE